MAYITLNRFILASERKHPGASGELSELLTLIGLGVKIISSLVQSAALRGAVGELQVTNVQGEIVKQLDREADATLIDILGSSGHFGSVVSEEQNDVFHNTKVKNDAKYVVAFDPLDGSSNIGTNIPVGTIFAIFRRENTSAPSSIQDYFQPTQKIIAAGYSVYGAMTSLVYSCGHGVHGFTLDPQIGEFLLTEEKIQTPSCGSIYSVNEGYSGKWDAKVQACVQALKGDDNPRKKPYDARYVGSLVSDFDRTLRRGGIFMHPANSDRPQGKLRLLYECMPLAFVIEQAGGASFDGRESFINRVPKEIHERSAFFVGGKEEMQWLRERS